MTRLLVALAAALTFSVSAAGFAQPEAAGEEAPADTTGRLRPEADPEAGLEESPGDSVLTERYRPPPSPSPGGDIRVVRGGSVALLGRRIPGVRDVGTGWHGHRVALTAGTRPAALSGLAVRERPAEDWLTGGLDLPSAAIACGPSAPAGHDLSVWPVYTSEWPGFLTGGDAPGGAGLAVRLRPVRRPYRRPFARLTLLTGDHDRKVTAAEFGRWYRDDAFALSGYFENDGGYAPGPGGRYDIERAGGAVIVPVGTTWMAEAGAIRTSLTRDDPHWALPRVTAHRVQVRTDAHVRVGGPTARFDAYHTRSWLESGPEGYAARSECNGLLAQAAGIWTLDSVRIRVERRIAEGWLLHGRHDALLAGAELRKTLFPGLGDVEVTAGLLTLDGVLSPSGGLSVEGGGDASGWEVAVGYGERHPTAMERFMRPVAVPVADGSEAEARGSDELKPEGVASLSGSCVWPGVLAGAGAKGEVCVAVDPIVPDLAGPDSISPVNAETEAGASAAIWVAAGDTSAVHGDLTLELLRVDPDGALNALTPVPVLRVGAGAAVPLSFFENYLRTSLEVALIHESGLARGPWKGSVEDHRTSLSLAATGTAGSARVFVSLENALSTDSARIPGADPGERVLTAGLSWTFID